MSSLFSLNNLIKDDMAYKKWKEKKLNKSFNYDQLNRTSYLTQIIDAGNPSTIELQNILTACENNSFCLYQISNTKSDTKKNIHALANALGISQLDSNICSDDDSLTSITTTPRSDQREYIPYSTKRLSWHTDGYYNKPEHKINSMLLHCSQPAKEGGESLLMDHELAFMLLRDKNPEYIKALTEPDALTIPANILEGKVIREAQTGPVFSTNLAGQLHMRYSARKRNIEWKNSPTTLKAVAFLDEILESDSKYIIKQTLKAGEGLICRNILHRRTAFVDFEDQTKKRLLYRGRYYDEITPHGKKSAKKGGGGS